MRVASHNQSKAKLFAKEYSNLKFDNLYHNLHKRSFGWDENFLTAGLAHLLRYFQKFEPKSFVGLVTQLTGVLAGLTEDQAEQVEIQTEFQTPFGRPDLSIAYDDSLVFVEVKVDSGFGQDQIENYLKALMHSRVNNTGLVCLTRFSRVNSSDNTVTGISWHQLSERLEQLEIDNTIANYLRNEYVDFLKIRGVAMGHVAENLVGGMVSLNNLLAMISTIFSDLDLSPKMANAGGWRGFKYKMDSDRSIWAGVYLDSPYQIQVETEGCSFGDSDTPEMGIIEGKKWLDVQKLENMFFSMSEHDQFDHVRHFLASRICYAEKLIESLREN